MKTLTGNKAAYRIRARLFYKVDHLLVRSDSLSRVVPLRRGNIAIDLRFPTEGDKDFELDDLTDQPPLIRSRTTIDNVEFSYVETVLATAIVTASADFLEDNLGEIVGSAVTEFIDWQRIGGQTWLGLFGTKVEEITEARRSIDEDTGQPPVYRYEMGINEINAMFRQVGGPRKVRQFVDQFSFAATNENLAEISERVVKRTKPGLADQMLADALHFANKDEPDVSRAILFSAIACECKVKEILVSRVHPSKRALVDCLIKNPRDFTMPVQGLFHSAMKAALGQSLHEYEKGELFDKLGKLFSIRNKLAHGNRLPEDSSLDYVDVAVKVFAWLESLPAQLAI